MTAVAAGESGTPKHNNNFDLIRLGAALLVLVSHSLLITQTRLPGPLAETLSTAQIGRLGVEIFFVVSGYLVSASWRSDPNRVRFAARRALRIFPGLIVVVIITAFDVAALMTTESFGAYMRDDQPWRYLTAFGFFPDPARIPTVFANNPLGDDANASLWTLRYEVLMYLVTPLLIRFGGLRRLIALETVLVATSVALASLGTISLPLNLTVDDLVSLSSFYIAGMILQQLPARYLSRRGAIWLLVTAAVMWVTPLAPLATVAGLAYGTVVVATALPTRFKLRGVDLSYGIYIYAWVVQQSALSRFGGTNWYLNLGISLPITLALAAASWFAVERRALRHKPRRPRDPSGALPPGTPAGSP